MRQHSHLVVLFCYMTDGLLQYRGRLKQKSLFYLFVKLYRLLDLSQEFGCMTLFKRQ